MNLDKKCLNAFGRVLGWVLVAASVAFIAVKISRTPPGSLEKYFTARAALIILLCTILYSLLNVVLAWAWVLLLLKLSPEADMGDLMRIHLRTGIVKYLPGNVFHLAGRHVLAGRAGASQGGILGANVLEMGGIAALAVVIAAVTTGMEFSENPLVAFGDMGQGVSKAAALLLAAACIAGAAIAIWAARMMSGKGRLKAISVAVSAYCLFLAASASLLFAMGRFIILPEEGGPVYITYLGAFSISWVAGFIVPGAPGGLGIRESVLLAVMARSLGSEGALAAALMLRTVTVLGDLLSFGYGFLGKGMGNHASFRT